MPIDPVITHQRYEASVNKHTKVIIATEYTDMWPVKEYNTTPVIKIIDDDYKFVIHTICLGQKPDKWNLVSEDSKGVRNIIPFKLIYDSQVNPDRAQNLSQISVYKKGEFVEVKKRQGRK
jgi:hypothetical protein